MRIEGKEKLNVKGGGGDWCWFTVVAAPKRGQFMLQNTRTKTYLNANPSNGKCTGGGGGGGWCHMEAEFVPDKPGHVRMKFPHMAGKKSQYLSFNPDTNEARTGEGGGWCHFTVVQKAKPRFRVGSCVALKLNNKGDRFLRIQGKETLNAKGTGGDWCWFNVVAGPGAHIKLQNTRTKTFVNANPSNGETGGGGGGGDWCHLMEERVPDKPNHVRLKFRHLKGQKSKYLSVHPDTGNARLGEGGGWCHFTVHKAPKAKLRAGKCVSLKLNNKGDRFLRIAGKETLNAKGTGGDWCWFNVVAGPGAHIKLQNTRTKTFVNANPSNGETGGGGGGGDWCHLMEERVPDKPNHVRLKFRHLKGQKSQYLSVHPDTGNARLGEGGGWCHFTVGKPLSLSALSLSSDSDF